MAEIVKTCEFVQDYSSYLNSSFLANNEPTVFLNIPICLENLDKRNCTCFSGRHEKLVDCPPDLDQEVRAVVWQPPFPSWIKVNTDGLSKGNPGSSACGGVFRSDSCNFIGGFAISLGTQSAYFAEVVAVFIAIEIAHLHGWRQLWLESDCLAVVRGIQNRNLDPPLRLKNIWKSCLQKIDSMNIYCSHIYREGNKVADALANLGLNYPEFQLWNHPPEQIQELLLHDSLGLPNYRYR